MQTIPRIRARNLIASDTNTAQLDSYRAMQRTAFKVAQSADEMTVDFVLYVRMGTIHKIEDRSRTGYILGRVQAAPNQSKGNDEWVKVYLAAEQNWFDRLLTTDACGEINLVLFAKGGKFCHVEDRSKESLNNLVPEFARK